MVVMTVITAVRAVAHVVANRSAEYCTGNRQQCAAITTAKLVADGLAGRRELGDARGPQPVEPGVVVVVEAVLAVLVVVEAVLCRGGDGRV